jgi:hypothetical protein
MTKQQVREYDAADEHLLASLSAISTQWNMARETVRRKLQDCGVKPSATRDGHPAYDLRDVSFAFAHGIPFPGCHRCNCAHCRQGRELAD